MITRVVIVTTGVTADLQELANSEEIFGALHIDVEEKSLIV